jgi:hypothetical protein
MISFPKKEYKDDESDLLSNDMFLSGKNISSVYCCDKFLEGEMFSERLIIVIEGVNHWPSASSTVHPRHTAI